VRGFIEDAFASHPRIDGWSNFPPTLTAENAVEHLAGEDDEMVKWLSGGRSTPASVEKAILNLQQNWQSGDPGWAFGVFDCATNRLVGLVEVNLARMVEPGQVNVSYGVFRPWRRQGLAVPTINLMNQHLRTATEARQIVLRIAPANLASLKFAEKAGFTFRGLFDEPEGRMARYVRAIESG
jgi:RimJ/RimL family protein N-acetyltransferase